ncbi:hypothetical protein KVH22_25560 [Streptomyces olivaceus]|uniref:hypothetical protein n=1 Tax=Streptomyces olivaceus TaxID=47716 RepID=UPI001CCDA851|nr:hypothetical protein [Streptomyces olivaceus]MBZ6258887.1 hypothetical protein [Streptomyces olivaceus]
MSPAVLHWRGILVPFITPWSSEAAPPPPVVVRYGVGGTGLGYADEDSRFDRWNDALWVRAPATRGHGVPRFAGIHALRQRQAMRRELCQVCGRPTFGTLPGERSLYLLGARDGDPIREEETTQAPPVHAACALLAIRECPHLRRGWAAALVQYAPAWGVAGILYDPATLAPLPGPAGAPDGLVEVPYIDEPRMRWVLAAREVVRLHGVEAVTDLEALAGEVRCG